MPFQTLNTFIKRLHDDITQTTPLPFGVVMRSNIRAAQGFEDEKFQNETNHKWAEYMSGTLNKNNSDSIKSDGTKQGHPDPKRFLYFWTWPLLIIRGCRVALMNAVNHLASTSDMGQQSESPAWAKGLKGFIASIFYPAEILSYVIAKIPDAVVGKVNNTRTRVGLICTGLAIAAAITTCVLFPPAIPIVLMAAKVALAGTLLSSAVSALYTIGAGAVNGIKAIANGISKLFKKKEAKKDVSIISKVDNSPVKQLIKPDLAKIQRVIPSPKSAKAPQLPHSPKAVRGDASPRNVPADHPVDRIKSILNEEVGEVKFHHDQPVPPNNRTEVIPPDNTVVQFHVDPSETPRP